MPQYYPLIMPIKIVHLEFDPLIAVHDCNHHLADDDSTIIIPGILLLIIYFISPTTFIFFK